MTKHAFINDRIKYDAASRLAIAAHIQLTRGYTVQIPSMSLAPDGSSFAMYADAGDLFALIPLAVKQCSYNFTSPEDFPYPTVIVSSVAQHDRPAMPPKIYYRCSADLQYVIEIPTASWERWDVKTIENNSYPGAAVEEACYFAPMDCVTFQKLSAPTNPYHAAG